MTTKVLIANYMEDFKCIGAKCEDSCCHGFEKVFIDQETYERYQNIDDPKLHSWINDRLTINEVATKAEYAVIQSSQDNRCPFLSSTGLCDIHSSLGAEYLSATCSRYPRIDNLVDSAWERSATLSCPETARLALLGESGIEFEERTLTTTTLPNIFAKKLEIKNSLSKSPHRAYFYELRTLTLSILKNRRYRISERLILLAMFFQRVENSVVQKTTQEIPQHIEFFSLNINDPNIKNEFSLIPSYPHLQIELLGELIKEGFMAKITNQGYLRCFDEFTKGIGFSDGAKLTDVGKNYIEAYHSEYQSFVTKHDYMLENYLVNQVFSSLFPFGLSSSVFEELILLIIRYVYIRLHLVGMAKYHRELEVEQALTLLQSFTKSFEHNEAKLIFLVDYLKSKGINSSAHMASLIKNQ